MINKPKKFFFNHWDEIFILLITIIFLIILFIPFFLNNSLDKFDTPGLLSLSWFIKEYTFPDFQGWNPYFFAGFPQGILYPPLFHWLVALLSHIFQLSIAYKFLITIIAALIPYSIYEFSLKIYKQKSWSLLNTLFILFTLIILPGYLGFNYDAIFDYGLGPSFMTIPLFFGYLTFLFDKKKNVSALAVLFSIMLLTNLVAPLIALIITITYFLLHFRRNKNLSTIFIKLGILIILLTTFWIIPYIIFREYTTSGVPPMRSNKILSIASIIGSTAAFLILIIKNRKKYLSQIALLIPGIIIGFLTLIDSLFEISIPPIHPFRIQIFSFLAIASSLTSLIQVLHPIFIKTATKLKFIKYVKLKTHLFSNFFILTSALIILLIIRLNPSGAEKVEITENINWQGRVIRSYKVTEVLDQSRSVIDKSVMANPDRFAVDGLLKESSYLAPYYQSLSKSLNPSNFNWEELDQCYIENYQLSKEKTDFLMKLLWVKSIFTIDPDFPNCNNFKEISSFKSNSKDDGIVDRKMYICSYLQSQNSNLVEMITSNPTTIDQNWNNELENWWKSDSQELFTNKEIKIQDTNNVVYVPQVEFSENFQKIYIKSGVEDTLYYLIKINYFPKWKALDKDGNEVEIIRTSPNFITIPITEEITLEYRMTKIEWIVLLISIISWISLVVTTIAKKLKYRKN